MSKIIPLLLILALAFAEGFSKELGKQTAKKLIDSRRKHDEQ